MQKRTIKKLGALLALMLVSTSAAAALKTSSGLVCFKEPGSTGGTLSNFFGTIQNLSPSSVLTVVCPLPREGDGISTSLVNKIRVFNRNSSNKVTCSFRSEFAQSNGQLSISSLATQTATGTVVQPQELLFFPVTNNFFAYYYARCTIPPITSFGNSGIISLEYSETGSR